MMKRREFIKLLGGAVAAWPLAARAQQARKIRTIGYLSPGAPVLPAATTAFSNGLLELGWVEGQNIAIERRWAENRLERLPELAAELGSPQR
jgi:putative tryptophan/tyrosine transport system substrate-binding protein